MATQSSTARLRTKPPNHPEIKTPNPPPKSGAFQAYVLPHDDIHVLHSKVLQGDSLLTGIRFLTGASEPALVSMLRSHLGGVLASTKSRTCHGAVKGMNDKINSISHRSFGFLKAETFITALYRR